MKAIIEFVEMIRKDFSCIDYALEDKDRKYFDPCVSAIIVRDDQKNNVSMGSINVPDDLSFWWSYVHEATLFKGLLHHQSGIYIFPGEYSKVATRKFFERSEGGSFKDGIVFGTFISDFDQAIVSCKEGPSYGKVFIAQQMVHFQKWPWVADSFLEFIQTFVNHKGEKFWENN